MTLDISNLQQIWKKVWDIEKLISEKKQTKKKQIVRIEHIGIFFLEVSQYVFFLHLINT